METEPKVKRSEWDGGKLYIDNMIQCIPSNRTVKDVFGTVLEITFPAVVVVAERGTFDMDYIDLLGRSRALKRSQLGNSGLQFKAHNWVRFCALIFPPTRDVYAPEGMTSQHG